MATLWALTALHVLDSGPGLDDEMQKRRARALEWLGGTEPGRSNEWYAARLVVAFQQDDEALTLELTRRLLAAQHEDGGWSWFEGDPSNPFSTGQTLYALAVTGGAREPISRAVDYLLARQLADGTWETPSHLISDEPSEEKDYIYEYWGTAWASLGLTRTLR